MLVEGKHREREGERGIPFAVRREFLAKQVLIFASVTLNARRAGQIIRIRASATI